MGSNKDRMEVVKTGVFAGNCMIFLSSKSWKDRIFFVLSYLVVTPLFIGLVLFLVVGTDGEMVTARINRSIFSEEEPVIGEASGDLESEQSGIVLGADARPVLLREYLERYNSPLVEHADLIFELSQKNGIDYRLIVAIAQQESNLCKKQPPNCHNCWGYGIHSRGTMCFESYEESLEKYAAYLKREYFDKGYKTPEDIMKKYAPLSNGSWAFGVNQFLDDIEKK